MTGLVIDTKICKSCGICIKSCATASIAEADGYLKVSDSCTLCGACVSACPFNAISIEKEPANDVDFGKYKDIWIFTEVHDGKLINVSLELMGKGRALADEKGCKLVAILLNHDSDGLAKELIYRGADQVLLCSNENLHNYSEELCTDIICRLITSRSPEILLFGATGFGRSIAPRVAARVKTGLTADCTILEIDKETKLLRQTRPAFGGNLMATIICPNHRPQMATVRSGIMHLAARNAKRTGEITKVAFSAKKLKSKVRVMDTKYEAAAVSIADAKILIVAGRGIGSKKNMKYVRDFAAAIGGVVGVSRPLVDSGWGEYYEQVGQTGTTVAPKLLISLGVSGAIQHLAGMVGAERIIAINSDPEAAIFGVCHYKIVGDCMEIIAEFMKSNKKM